MNEITTTEQYQLFVEQLKATITEAVHNSRWFLVEGYWNVGKQIREYFTEDITNQLQSIAVDVGIGERTLWYAVQFYDAYPLLANVPEGKNITWTKLITKYLSKAKEKPLDDFGGAYVKLDRYLKFIKDLVSESAYREFEHWGEEGRRLLEDYDSRRTAPVEILDEEELAQVVVHGHMHEGKPAEDRVFKNIVDKESTGEFDWMDNTDLVIGS